MIAFGREVCGNLEYAGKLEWLVTNGIGGYASGTIAGLLTRTYHGLLIAALKPPLGRTLLLAKIDDTANYDGQDYPLFSNHWATGVIEPHGYRYLEQFHLEGATPVWTYALQDALLEKRIWMQQGANTTYIHYTYVRSLHSPSAPAIQLSIKALVNFRNHHEVIHIGQLPKMRAELEDQGIKVTAFNGITSFYLLSASANATLNNDWYADYYLPMEAYRGLDAVEDHMDAGVFQATLQPGETITLVASTQPRPMLNGKNAYLDQQAHERRLYTAALPAKNDETTIPKEDLDTIRQLALAANQFIVQRVSVTEPQGNSIIAGYHWFGDWGRDTMISLPGLTLATGRPDIARRILRTFAAYVDQGMLPNRFPDEGETPEYNTVDATLWYFEALRAYHVASGDDDLLNELFPVLQEIISWYLRGTRFKIHCDPQDGLIYAGEPGVQLTWMDAKVDDWVVTPRIGKPVEINALWFNALKVMEDIADRLKQDASIYHSVAEKAQQGFDRFWNQEKGYCYDVLDSPSGDDLSLRPNQLFAVSLMHSPLNHERQRAIVDTCARHLLTSHGLRSLSPDEPGYIGRYGGDRRQRDAAYHQGTVWAWLIGPFISAYLRVYDDPVAAKTYLAPLLRHFSSAHCIGSISEIFDGDPPFEPHGCIAQAWSVAEVLRVWWEINKTRSE
jgi:predicted glycogen debranching enzyme